MDRAAAADAIEEFLRALGLAGTADTQGTGARVASLWIDELLDGMRLDAARVLGDVIAVPEGAPLVAVERIATHLVCPHHLTIGTGHASVYYLPSDRVVGLGAITDLVQAFTHRLVLQEEAGERVAESLVAHLGARGAACVLTFRHGCMELHGQKKRARVRTVSMKGSFANKGADRSLVLAAIRSAR